MVLFFLASLGLSLSLSLSSNSNDGNGFSVTHAFSLHMDSMAFFVSSGICLDFFPGKSTKEEEEEETVAWGRGELEEEGLEPKRLSKQFRSPLISPIPLGAETIPPPFRGQSLVSGCCVRRRRGRWRQMTTQEQDASRGVIGNYYKHSLQWGILAEDFRIVSKRRRGGYCYTKHEVRGKKRKAVVAA